MDIDTKGTLILGGKCIPTLEQAKGLRNKGCTYFEAHTTDKFMHEFNHNDLTQLLSDMKMYCVHSPMHNDIMEFTLGNSGAEYNKIFMEAMKHTLDFTNAYANVIEPVVVLHTGVAVDLDKIYHKENIIKFKKEEMKIIQEQLYELENYREMKKYNLRIAIENTNFYTEKPFVVKGGATGTVRCIGGHYDTANIVDIVNKDKVGTCLDLCHALMDVLHLRIVDIESSESIKSYIAEFANNIHIVHFSNSINFGLGKDHAQTYEGYEDLHSKVVKTLLQYNYVKCHGHLKYMKMHM